MPELPELDLESLRLLVWIEELGSIGAAARRALAQRRRRVAATPDAPRGRVFRCLGIRCAMSGSADLSRVNALSQKGTDLVFKGHNARAAESYARAAAEAQNSLHGGADCLVTCALRHEQLEALLSHATVSAATPADADAVLREVWCTLLPAVMATLQARMAARTLLQGACSASEKA